MVRKFASMYPGTAERSRMNLVSLAAPLLLWHVTQRSWNTVASVRRNSAFETHLPLPSQAESPSDIEAPAKAVKASLPTTRRARGFVCDHPIGSTPNSLDRPSLTTRS